MSCEELNFHVREARIEDVEFLANNNIKCAYESEGMVLSLPVAQAGAHAIFDHPERGRYFIAELLNKQQQQEEKEEEEEEEEEKIEENDEEKEKDRRKVDKEDKRIGSLLVTFEWSDWKNAMIWWLQSVYVDSNYRGQGVFMSMCQYVKQQGVSQQIRSIRLYVDRSNIKAIQAYQKLDFQLSHYEIMEFESF
jgi:GNAT superfamily N-acetyltransferase